MGILYDNECSYCKSKEHVSEDCPHNKGFIFGGDTKCSHCGSIDHSSANCPHDKGFIFGGETKCSHCGSIEHSSANCPHDKGFIFGGETKCSHCGSKDHSSASCPHDKGFIFGGDTKCAHCGSKNHASKNCPQNRAASSLNDLLGKILGYVVVIAGLIWLAFKVALPLLIINLSIIALLLGLFFRKGWRKFMLPISVLGAILIIVDYNKGWLTKSLVESVSFFHNLIPFFFYLNIAAGLVALYFLIDEYYLKTNENVSHILFKNKKQNITIASIVLFGAGIIALQKFVLDNYDYQNESNIESLSYSSNSTSSETSSQSDIQNANTPQEATESVSNPTSESNSYYDENCKTTIRNFVQAEDNRDFNTLYSYMASNLERYWDMESPSQGDLNKRYTKIWAKLTSSSNTINEIIKTDNNTFDLHNTFTFTGKKTGETKTVSSIVRYKFDGEGKIIYINEVK